MHAPIDSSHWKTSIDEEGRRSLMLLWLCRPIQANLLILGSFFFWASLPSGRVCVIVSSPTNDGMGRTGPGSEGACEGC